MAGLSAGFFYDPDGPFGPLAKNSVLLGANEAIIDFDQKWPKTVCYGVPTKL